MDVYADEQLRNFYTFLFPFLKDDGQKSLPGELAVAVWGIVLAPRWGVAKKFVEFAAVRLSLPSLCCVWESADACGAPDK